MDRLRSAVLWQRKSICKGCGLTEAEHTGFEVTRGKLPHPSCLHAGTRVDYQDISCVFDDDSILFVHRDGFRSDSVFVNRYDVLL